MITTQIDRFLTGYFEESQSELLLFSAYCTSEALEYVLSNVDDDVIIKFVTRWSKQDIEKGSSDLEVFDIIRSVDGEFYRHPNLHLKLYIRDKEQKIHGSANITQHGIGVVEQSNIEHLSEIQSISHETILFANNVIENSQKVTEKYVEELRDQIEEHDASTWNEEILDELDQSRDGIFLNDFPFTEHPEVLQKNPFLSRVKHDKVVFGLSEKPIEDEIKKSFRTSKIVNWFSNQFDEKIHFGELTQRIHKNLLDEPPPYRSTVKEVQSNLFNWIDEILYDEYIIDTPSSQSQVLKQK